MLKALRPFAFALVAAAAVPFANASAQDAAFGAGTKILNLGIVTDPTGFGGSFEIGLMELAPRFTLGIGATGVYQSQSSFGVDASTTWIVGNANLHYAIEGVPALDLFGGVSLGVARVSVDAPGIGDASDSESVFGINLGGRYMFTPKVGAFGQIGIADAPEIFLGVTIKF